MPRTRLTRADYRHFEACATRWRDDGVWRHMNNAVTFDHVDTSVPEVGHADIENARWP